MSQLQLSGKVVSDIREVLSQHDPAAQDPGVASQYLSAVIGFLLGQEGMPEQKVRVYVSSNRKTHSGGFRRKVS